ncbi:MAG TPA: hypothetical protein VIT90_17390 [Lysobacter sp.]
MNLPRQEVTRPDLETIGPGLEDLLRHAVAVGAALVLLLPAARGFSDTLGWMPLWLLAMPLSAWWALRRFRLPARGETVDVQPRMRRRSGEQARRRRLVGSVRRKQPQAA